MSEAHETLENAEQAAHGGGHQSPNSKIFGVTMALIGVLIALCSAMVGSERSELTRAMIEQTQAHSDYTSASTKFRLIMIELEKQTARVAAARDVPGGISPVKRFIELAADYTIERGVAKKWAESYAPAVQAHFEAAEGYEKAQVIAEVGIVLASLGVLLGSRAAWLISVILSLTCIVQVSRTFIPARHELREAREHIRHAEEAYQELRKAHIGAAEDEKVIERLDPDGKIRAELQSRGNSQPDDPPKKETPTPAAK
jgi:hypothetical protein